MSNKWKYDSINLKKIKIIKISFTFQHLVDFVEALKSVVYTIFNIDYRTKFFSSRTEPTQMNNLDVAAIGMLSSKYFHPF